MAGRCSSVSTGLVIELEFAFQFFLPDSDDRFRPNTSSILPRVIGGTPVDLFRVGGTQLGQISIFVGSARANPCYLAPATRIPVTRLARPRELPCRSSRASLRVFSLP